MQVNIFDSVRLTLIDTHVRRECVRAMDVNKQPCLCEALVLILLINSRKVNSTIIITGSASGQCFVQPHVEFRSPNVSARCICVAFLSLNIYHFALRTMHNIFVHSLFATTNRPQHRTHSNENRFGFLLLFYWIDSGQMVFRIRIADIHHVTFAILYILLGPLTARQMSKAICSISRAAGRIHKRVCGQWHLFGCFDIVTDSRQIHLFFFSKFLIQFICGIFIQYLLWMLFNFIVQVR